LECRSWSWRSPHSRKLRICGQQEGGKESDGRQSFGLVCGGGWEWGLGGARA
jgi:hypothetical protein